MLSCLGRFICCCYDYGRVEQERGQTPVAKQVVQHPDPVIEQPCSTTPLSERMVQVTPVKYSELQQMTWGLDAVSCHPDQGLPRPILGQFIAAVQTRGYVFSHRPVPPLCKTLLQEGYPTKPFAIKGKSANAGFQYGFICVEQGYSKLNGSSPQRIKKANADVAGVSADVAVPAPLQISEQRRQELVNAFPDTITLVQEKRDLFGHSMTYEVRAPAGTKWRQVLVFNQEKSCWYGHMDVDGKVNPLLVLCHPTTQQPITADVDPLFEAHKQEELDLANEDRLPVPLISLDKIRQRISSYERTRERRSSDSSILEPTRLKHSQSLSKSIELLRQGTETAEFLRKEDPRQGNVSPRARRMIEHYGASETSAIHRSSPLVHHNFDATSPFSNEADNYPATIYFPDWVVNSIEELRQRGAKVALIHNHEQMKAVIQLLKDNHLYVPVNPAWKDLASVRADWFVKAQKNLKHPLAVVYRKNSAPECMAEFVASTR